MTIAIEQAGGDIRARKRPYMYAVILTVSLLAALWFDPKLARTFAVAGSAGGAVALTLVIAILNFYWLYAIYYVTLCLFSWLPSRAAAATAPLTPERSPKAAVLYLTRNDFDEAGIESCLRQDYTNFEVYILDDSTTAAARAEVDAFVARGDNRLHLIRRSDRRGFKAGSLNNALSQHVTDCAYFAVIDADGVIPPDFLSSAMPHFERGRDVGFVQVASGGRLMQKSRFARDLSPGIAPFWLSYFPARDEFGFLPFQGHSGVLRYEMWRAVGGFPEVVAEDLALSTLACQAGYRGVFVKSMACGEDFPSSFMHFRRQQEKYVKSACEYLHRAFLPFARSKEALWFEKVDVLLYCSSVFLPALNMLFMLAMIWFDVSIGGAHRHASHWAWSLPRPAEVAARQSIIFRHVGGAYYLLSVIGVVAPVLPLMRLASRPAELIRLLAVSATSYLSMMFLSFVALWTYVLTRRAPFPVTAGAGDEAHGHAEPPQSRWRAWLDRLNHGSLIVHVGEAAIGTALSLFAAWTGNFPMLGMGSAMVVSPILQRGDYEHRLIRGLCLLPFALTLGGLFVWSLGEAPVLTHLVTTQLLRFSTVLGR